MLKGEKGLKRKVSAIMLTLLFIGMHARIQIRPGPPHANPELFSKLQNWLKSKKIRRSYGIYSNFSFG